MKHPYKILKYKNQKVWIDKDIISLLQKMWKLGIETTVSCQKSCNLQCNHKYKIHPKDKYGNRFYEKIESKNCLNNIWVAFESVKDLEKFYNIVAEFFPSNINKKINKDQDIYYHMLGYGSFKENPNKWSKVFSLDNEGARGYFKKTTKKGFKRATSPHLVLTDCQKNNFVVRPQITFPIIHLEYIEKKLDEELKKIKIK